MKKVNSAFEILMEGKAEDQEIFDFLTLLSEKGEASDEIAGGVFVLRKKSKRVNVENCVDTCGTGGDGMNTVNISTASALLLQVWVLKLQNMEIKLYLLNVDLVMFWKL